MSVRVKICGITSSRDALMALEAGADALGFIFCASSPRCVTPDQAARIILELPPFTPRVGVFVNEEESRINAVLQSAGINTLQLHGEEPPSFCARFPFQVIKAFRVRDERSLEQMREYPQQAWLLDSYVPGKRGGTGERFNWELAQRATKLSTHVILAGGLTPLNVAEAVQWVGPYAVDVSSGVESAPGVKDAAKVRDFIQAAKAGSTTRRPQG